MSSALENTVLTIKNEIKSHNGWIRQYTHQSNSTKTEMRFTIFFPQPQCTTTSTADNNNPPPPPVPIVYYLSGLTCTDDNVTQKGYAHKICVEKGIGFIAPDTSPRGANIEGEDDSWDFGTGAGFYVNATESKWERNYQMYTYIVEELPFVIKTNFSTLLDTSKASIMGHSMGGHGALTIAMKNPTLYQSCSAFSPICHPTIVPWGEKAFSGYLGDHDKKTWDEHDATLLMKSKGPFAFPILIDQGDNDNFYKGDVNQLQTMKFKEIFDEKNQKGKIRLQEGYDHSYFFISSFMEDHIAFHADQLF